MSGVSLFNAALKGDVTLVQKLLNEGADVNWQNEDGWTPLMIASGNGKTEVVELLLRSQADINKAKNNGMTPLYVAASRGQKEVVEVLTKAGADVNKADRDGATPLIIASQEGKEEVVEVLLSTGADVDKAASEGFTALMAAAIGGDVPTAKVLLQHGTAIETKDKDGYTALTYASNNGKHEMVEFLIQQGARHDHLDESDITAKGTDDPKIKKQVEKSLTRPEIHFKPGIDDTSITWSPVEKLSLIRGYNTRLFTAGELMSGKTSLARSFLSQTQYRAYESDRTVVVEQRQWAATENTVIPIMDLGGHKSYRVTAAFFITNSTNTITALCNDMNYKRYQTTYKWIKDLLSLAPKSHIIPVLTKADLVPEDQHTQRKIEFETEIGKYLEQDIKDLKKKQFSSHDHEKVKEQIERYEKLKNDLGSLIHIVSTAPLKQDSIESLKTTIINWTKQKVELPEVYQHFYMRIGKMGAKKKEIKKSKFQKLKTWVTSKVAVRSPGKSETSHFYVSANDESQSMSSEHVSHDITRTVAKLEIQPPECSTDVQTTGELNIQSSRHVADHSATQELEIQSPKKYLTLGEATEIFNEVRKKYDKKQKREDYNVRRCLSVLHQLGFLYWYQGSDILEHYVFNDSTTLVLILKSVFHHDVDDKLHFKNLPLKQQASFQNDELMFNKNLEMLRRKGILTKAILNALLDLNGCDIDGDFVADLLAHTKVGYKFNVAVKDDPLIFIPFYVEDTLIPHTIIPIATEIKTTTANKVALQININGNITQSYFNRLLVQFYQQFYKVKDHDMKQEVWGQGVWMMVGNFQLLVIFNGQSNIEMCVQGNVNDLPEMWRYVRYVHAESGQLQQDWTPGMVTQSTISCIICEWHKTRSERPEEAPLCQLDLEEILESAGGPYTCKTTGQTIPAAFVTPLDKGDKACALMMEEIRQFLSSKEKRPEAPRKRWELRALETMHPDPVINLLFSQCAITLEEKMKMDGLTPFSQIELILEKVTERDLIKCLKESEYHTNMTLATLIETHGTDTDLVEEDYFSEAEMKALIESFYMIFIKADVDELFPWLQQNNTLDENFRLEEFNMRETKTKRAMYLMDYILLRGTHTTLRNFEEAIIGSSNQVYLMDSLRECLPQFPHLQ